LARHEDRSVLLLPTHLPGRAPLRILRVRLAVPEPARSHPQPLPPQLPALLTLRDGLRDEAHASRRTDSSSSWATSSTSTDSGAAPSACNPVSPSLNITRQNGHPVAIAPPPSPPACCRVCTASWVRFTLMRVPIFSSIHIRAPPAPQQN